MALTPGTPWPTLSRVEVLRRLRGAPPLEALRPIGEGLVRALKAAAPLSEGGFEEVLGVIEQTLEVGAAPSDEAAAALLGRLGPRLDGLLEAWGPPGENVGEELVAFMALFASSPLWGLTPPPPALPAPPPPLVGAFWTGWRRWPRRPKPTLVGGGGQFPRACRSSRPRGPLKGLLPPSSLPPSLPCPLHRPHLRRLRPSWRR